jgi:hypothetical protein
MQKIAFLHQVSPSTMHKWFHQLEIPIRTPKVCIQEVNGVPHRFCTGPTHVPPGAWVPLDKFWKSKSRPFGTHGRCVACKNSNQRVKFTDSYRAWVLSIVRRVGFMETTRRLDVSERTLHIWLGRDRYRNPPQSISRSHAVKIVQMIIELKLTGEVRHRTSIRRGAKIRGEPERAVKSNDDLYERQTDAEADYKRRRRKDPEFRKAQNERLNARRRARRLAKKAAA